MKYDKYIGCDLHQATTVVAVLDGEGKVVLETIIATEAAAVIRFLKSLSGPLHITFEETTQVRWMYDVVRGYVSEAIVCDPADWIARRAPSASPLKFGRRSASVPFG